MIDLHDAFQRQALEKRIEQDIEEFCIKEYPNDHREHLGASLIGHDCSRYLWLKFRWAKVENFIGRMRRLFQRGHREEPELIKLLRGIGFEVADIDPLSETGSQFRVSACRGHFGGSLDGLNKPPARYQILQNILMCEFKTNATGPKFMAVRNKGVAYAKPQHFAQMSTYGFMRGIEFAIYMIVNKNDDDIIIKVVKLDMALGADCLRKAEHIITVKEPPAKIAENETFHVCAYCDFRGICFHKEPVQKNCRSCKHAEPIDGGQWGCHLYKQIIPADFIRQGCNDHVGIM